MSLRSSIRCLVKSSRPFSTSAISQMPRRIDPDSKQGRILPKPLERIPEPETDPNHPLWGFFRDKKALPYPEDEKLAGRGWTVFELRSKSFEDLHTLWYVCLKELNIMATQMAERRRLMVAHQTSDHKERRNAVRKTMQGIKFTLSERVVAYEQARELAIAEGTITPEDLAAIQAQKKEEEEKNEQSVAAREELKEPKNRRLERKKRRVMRALELAEFRAEREAAEAQAKALAA
ncbi:54S ribosomal protein L4 mitochondrial [Saitoella coloradoensis]